MNRSGVSDEMLEGAFTTYGADEELAVATLLQCSTEIHLVLQAMNNGCADYMVQTTLLCIAQRMEVAARLASEPTESVTDVQAKTAMSGSQPGTPQPKTSQTLSESFMAENKPKRVRGGAP